jgi:hypothetical protein
MLEQLLMNRNDFTLFPQLDELLEIIAKEQQRALPKGKETIHYPDFTLINQLLKEIAINSSFFTDEYRLEDIRNKNVPDIARKLSDDVVEGMNVDHEQFKHLYNRMYDYLSEEDQLEKTDIMFVFGSKSNTRIEKAVELMKEGYAKYLLVSGSAPMYDKDKTITEAERLGQYAIENGIDKEQIIIENGSISIPDNIRSSLNLLDEKGNIFNSIMLVNSPYSQRRGWVHFKKYLPDNVKVVRVNAKTIEKYTRDGWYKNEDGIRVILNEFIKMKIAVILNTA